MIRSEEGCRALRERRSVRRFRPEQIPEEDLRTILRVAADGPNARNLQRFHFTVVRDAALLDHMAELIRRQMLESGGEQAETASRPGYSSLHHAPTVVFVTGDLKSSFHVHTDCGIAAGLIVAAATELGVASCVTASSLFMFRGPEGEELRRRLAIPEGYQCVCTVALGYLDGELPPRPEKKDGVITWLG